VKSGGLRGFCLQGYEACRLVFRYERYGGTSCLHLQGSPRSDMVTLITDMILSLSSPFEVKHSVKKHAHSEGKVLYHCCSARKFVT